ncbi:MAG: hypothetical protein GY724_27905 [Actinomycetia bacterium]|nr:hypothetical protein [Actinomycetes bacterium]MCP4221938.1 hypothetical protein [Actinomycetes bacterium]MCP5031864.1 hypothetical protein [Actinomycetes bacterium]
MKAWHPEAVFPSVLAHQGGWDEILLVGVPLVVVGLALWLANKRATAQIDEAGVEEAPSEHDG